MYLAITDLEMSGLDPVHHEILEIALILVDVVTLSIVDIWETKVKPSHIETANPAALKKMGYDEVVWQNTLPLFDAMALFAEKTQGAQFASYPVWVDRPFVDRAFRETGVIDLTLSHDLCLWRYAELRLVCSRPRSFHLNTVAQFLGLQPEPDPHRAINGAQLAYEVYKALRWI